MGSVIGTAVKRREDPALITGQGKYTDDLSLPGMVHAIIVRSPHAHARIRRVDASKARAVPGVLAVYTAQDVERAGVPGVIPVAWLLPGIKTPAHPMLARDVVRYVGDAIAVVVADERYIARDAADLVEVTYEPRPAVVDAAKAVEDGAPLVHADVPRNISFEWGLLGDEKRTDEALSAAPRRVELELRNNRMLPHAIEPRSALASWDEAKGSLTVWMTSQNPHVHRLLMSLASLGLPEHRIRVIAPEVGGGFGSKIHHYPDEAITAFCAMQLKRPVKWTATRSEANQTDAHGRDHVTRAEMGFDDQGRILAVRCRTHASLGAYLSTFAPATPTVLHVPLFSGQYDVPAIHVKVTGVFTHTAPVDAARGAGRPEATFVIERLMDLAAGTLGLDPAEIRRRNFVPPDRFPFQTQVAVVYDSGNYAPALDKALQMVGYESLRAEQRQRRPDGKLLGIGLSCYIEACGLAPSKVAGALGGQAGLWESATVRVHPSGTVTVLTGSSAHGQGHKTTFSQIVADRLGLPFDKIDIIAGDTEEVQFGMGTYGSRSAAVGGSAIVTSVDKLVAKGRKIAAHLLEVAEEDLVFEEGAYRVRGAPAKQRSWGDVVLQAYLAHNLPADLEPGMEATTFYDPSNFTFPFGTHIAIVEVDPETGEVALRRYVAVDDVGNMINPTIVEGQLHGGIVHGIGQALFEQVVYDENGQLLTATLMDYALPKAHQVVSFELGHTVTPCPHNPLGVKGVGEAGAIAAPAAVTNAVVDALKPLGVTHLDMPLTPEKVWRAIRSRRRS